MKIVLPLKKKKKRKMCKHFHLQAYICLLNIFFNEYLCNTFFASNMSSTVHSHVTSLFTSEDYKNFGS